MRADWFSETQYSTGSANACRRLSEYVDADRPVVRAAVVERDVPGGPRRDAARQQAVAAVDDRLVARERHARERVALVVARVGQQRERLVGMAGQDHAIEALGDARRPP